MGHPAIHFHEQFDSIYVAAQLKEIEIQTKLEEVEIELFNDMPNDNKVALLQEAQDKCIRYKSKIEIDKNNFELGLKASQSLIKHFHEFKRHFNAKLTVLDDIIRRMKQCYDQMEDSKGLLGQDQSHIALQQLQIKLQETKARLTRKSS